jgi:hypothetical protein
VNTKIKKEINIRGLSLHVGLNLQKINLKINKIELIHVRLTLKVVLMFTMASSINN